MPHADSTLRTTEPAHRDHHATGCTFASHLCRPSLAAVALALVTLLRRHGVEVWRGFRVGCPVSTTVVIFVVTMVITKILDRSVNMLAEDFEVLTAPSIHVLVSTLEEIMELSPPMVAAIGWWQVSRSRPLD